MKSFFIFHIALVTLLSGSPGEEKKKKNKIKIKLAGGVGERVELGDSVGGQQGEERE